MEKEYRVSWLKVVGILVLIVGLVGILCLVYPKNTKKVQNNASTYIHNITLMKEAGFEYFHNERLPKDMDDSVKLTLSEMIERNLLIEFFDEEGKACNKEDSYILVTKTLENEYSMKVYLSCPAKADFIMTTIVDNNCINCNVSDNQSRPVVDNKQNNSNQTSNKVPIYAKPTTNITYHINYVNNCGICTGVNCNGCTSNVYYTVHYDANGGSNSGSITVKYGEFAPYRETVLNGYQFMGWYLNGVKYDFSTPITKGITLVAKWQKIDEKVKEYEVNFDTNGGSKIPSQTILEGKKASKPANPTRLCYRFVGWYTDAKLTTPYSFNQSVYRNMTLYAKWEDDGSCKEVYQVKFKSNGGSAVETQKVEEGQRAYEPNDSVRKGYLFKGWYQNSSLTKKYNFSNRVYSDITLYAKWEKEEVKYHTYCKINQERYFSTSYVNADQKTWNYNWTIRFDRIKANDLRITNVGYLNTNALYNEAWNSSNKKNISMVNLDVNSVAPYKSLDNLKMYSLKQNNFDKYLSQAYYQNGYWYTNAYVSIRNYNSVNAYYASNLNKYIYIVPFYFDVEYTDQYNCVDDKASNLYKYSDYKIVDTYYR